MKRFLTLIGAAIAALLLSACAGPAPVKAAVDPASDREMVATAVATCATAIERIATSAGGDPGSRVAAVGAIERLCGAGGSSHFAALLQAPPAQPQMGIGGHLWQAALEVGKVALQVYGIRATRDVGIVQSNNQAATTIAGYQTFGLMGGQVRDAGIAGYPYVQAPGASTTNTLSGTGVIGAGTYTGPVTTTRTCTGGNAAGGTTTSGGPGGGANC